ncbi:MAG TPA: hypothetical protein VK645_10845 [Chitinophagaceae bacterium]|nr:hypothetical protein [Chitinophagaceae bacterium]
MSPLFNLQKIALAVFVVQLLHLPVAAQSVWPKEIPASDGSRITVYEPQPEKYADNSMYARAAVSIIRKAGDEPVFGVMWFNATLETDSRMATLKQVTVVQSKFADNDEASKTLLLNAVEKGMPAMNIQFEVSRLQSVLQEEKEETGADLKNDPPLILYRDKPTTLIVLDGEPVEQQDDDLKMTRIVNSPYLIVKNPDDKKYYLYGGNFWYSSSQVKDGWKNVKSLPSKIKEIDAVMKEEAKKDTAQKDETTFTSTTDILVSTVPAELIQTEGAPTYQAVEGSTLLYVNNSLDEIFKDVESQKNYILIAGRWYRSTTLNGPWEYVEPDALPAAFANIPAGSEKDGVLASVAGTDEANEAMIDARVPQTAKVNRSTATCEVTYDGDPKFVTIENTNLSVAENSSLTVMLAPNNQYYALENGIWFISSNANGPWQVANERPSDVEKIPVSNSAYNARYVYVYQTTPQYVYVGYTHGYMGNYIGRRTVVWGTGWHYRPWYGRRFWPRPYTWGFGMHYNPWVGWSIRFGLGFNNAWYRYRNQHVWGCGWFGPPRYRPPYRPWGWNGGYYGNRQVNNRPIIRPNITYNRPANWNRPQPARPQRPVNIYNRRRDVVVTRDNIQRPVRRPVGRPGDNNNDNNRPGRPGGDNNGNRPVTRPVIQPGDNNNRPGRPDNNGNRPVTRPITTPGDNNNRPGRRPGDNNGNRPVTRPVVTQPADNNRPVTRPITRPITRPADNDRPVTRPVTPPADNNRPVTRPVTRPITRPADNNRPLTRPITRPAQQQQQPVNNRPATRPVTRPARQPNQNRPVARPGGGERKRDN